jgi:large subunit ribosomal protein L9
MAQNVQVILARDVPNLGRLGELVSVRPGYARNFLVPQRLALPASSSRVSQFEHQKKLVEHKRRLLRAESEKKAKAMGDVVVTLTAKVGEQNKLFGSITGRDISRALASIGHDIHHKDIKLEEPIRSIGSYSLDVRLEGDVDAKIKVVIAPEVVVAAAGDSDAEEEVAPAADSDTEAAAADA